MTVETKDLAKAEIEFLSDKCEKLEEEIKRYQSAIMSIECYTAAMGGGRLEMIRALGNIDDICKEALS